MKFIDLVTIQVKAGKGGDGIIAFRRELYVPKGGPSGGDGGHGGNIIFVGNTGINTLFELRKNKIITAEPGQNGKIKNMTGKNGHDTIIQVPLGTIVRNQTTNEILADIVSEKQSVIIAKGGTGGRGNAKFASATNRVPRISENGALGAALTIVCELKLLANAGLIGLPNVGKSTLVGAISQARPTVANYPFTTLTPHLGVVNVHEDSFVIADLPGLIAGASLGKGLGLQFLKHIERCEVLVHLIDISDQTSEHFLTYQLIRQELAKYNKKILEKPEIIVLNKIDLLLDQTIIDQFQAQVKQPVYPISALNHENLKPTILAIHEAVKVAQANPLINDDLENAGHVLYQYQQETQAEALQVTKVAPKQWKVTGSVLEQVSQKNPLNTHQNQLLYQIQLQDLGVFEALRTAGVQEGDQVIIYNYDMIWK